MNEVNALSLLRYSLVVGGEVRFFYILDFAACCVFASHRLLALKLSTDISEHGAGAEISMQ